ncbi:hypothetical protein [Paenibacillus arenilitoris]|uniref:Uncharacterized protein n=1 Tax=Paenibacillus arenilitoris TaxID=2772299 RepID=A0A927CNB4_9BACL|nr:hypothetical protein [Paenibacillus arenilitoris]MBD2870714.1 hypothetical protein [Paenibacillus arenilitoris]
MLGTWRWNAVFGGVGVVLTAAFSFGSNPVAVVMLRSFYAFVAFFVLAYAARALLAYILRPPTLAPSQSGQEDGLGAQFDAKTPDETDDLNQLLKSQLQEGATAQPPEEKQAKAADAAQFRPLKPPQLLSTKNSQPEELAKAIRHLTGE